MPTHCYLSVFLKGIESGPGGGISPQDGEEGEVRHERMLGSRKTALVRDGKIRKSKGHRFVSQLL